MKILQNGTMVVTNNSLNLDMNVYKGKKSKQPKFQKDNSLQLKEEDQMEKKL